MTSPAFGAAMAAIVLRLDELERLQTNTAAAVIDLAEGLDGLAARIERLEETNDGP